MAAMVNDNIEGAEERRWGVMLAGTDRWDDSYGDDVNDALAYAVRSTMVDGRTREVVLEVERRFATDPTRTVPVWRVFAETPGLATVLRIG